MIKKIFLVIGFSTLSYATEKTYQVAQVEKSQFAEIDAYIASFNEVFKLAEEHKDQPAMILQKSRALQALSPDEKKLLVAKLVNSSGSYLKLVRSGASVFIIHQTTRLKLATIDVAKFSETGMVSLDGRAINLRAMLAEATLKKRSAMLMAEIKKVMDARKATAQKVWEKVLFVVTLPFTVLTGCTEGQYPPAGSDAHKAMSSSIANGNDISFTSTTLRPRGFEFNGHGGMSAPPTQTGYNCSNGACYDRNGNRVNPANFY